MGTHKLYGQVPESDITGLVTDLGNKQNTSGKGAASGYASLDSATRVPNAQMPLVLSPIAATGPTSGTFSIDASTGSNNRNHTANGAVTVAVPTNGVDGQVIQLAVLASGGSRVITWNASYARLTGIDAAYTVASGKLLRASIRYSSLLTLWVVEAAAVTL